jgi:hypothetical protein
MLHNNAEKAGIRCAYVSLDMVGYSDPYNLGIASDAGHACNAFETTDRGLVYIDCTGNPDSGGPANNDMIVDVQIGREYIPRFVFPSGGWTIDSMGTVTGIFMTWDGNWRNQNNMNLPSTSILLTTLSCHIHVHWCFVWHRFTPFWWT